MKKENEFYVMDEAFYKSNELKSPISRMEMDYYDKRQQVTANTKTFGDKEVVLSFK